MRAVIYSRFSSQEQSGGHSLVRQTTDCRAYIASQGWTATGEEIADLGVSAYSGANLDTGELGAFERRVLDGQYGPGHVLVVERLDRLSRRSATDVWKWLDRITSAGMSISTVDGGAIYRANTPLDMTEILTMVIKSSLANEESSKKAQRASAVIAFKRTRLGAGKIMTSRVPAWLEVREGTIHAITARAAVVRQIFQLADEGAGKGSIAKKLNRENVPGFAGGSWSQNYVWKILTNTAVLGDYQPMTKAGLKKREPVGDVVRGYYPAIVAADVFARVNDRREMEGRKTMGERGDAIVNIFSGLAKCGTCGGRASYMNRTLANRLVIKKYLVCDRSRRGTCTDNRRYNYEALLTRTLDLVLAISLNDRHFSAPADATRLETVAAELERTRADVRRKADAALELYLEAKRENVKARYDALEAEADALEVEIASTRGELLAARGAVAPLQHQKRVQAMRALIDDDDSETRLKARAKVMAALRATVDSMTLSNGRVTLSIPGAVISYAVTGLPAHDVTYTDEGSKVIEAWRVSAVVGSEPLRMAA